MVIAVGWVIGWQFGVVLFNLAYLAESQGLDFGEKNGKAAFRFSSARPRDGSSKTAKALPVVKVVCTDSQALCD